MDANNARKGTSVSPPARTMRAATRTIAKIIVRIPTPKATPKPISRSGRCEDSRAFVSGTHDYHLLSVCYRRRIDGPLLNGSVVRSMASTKERLMISAFVSRTEVHSPISCLSVGYL
jgi:hypothetical protein